MVSRKKLNESIYLSSPRWLQFLLVNTQSWLNQRKKLGNYFWATLADLEKSQWLPPEIWQAHQLNQLKILISQAFHFSPYYREWAQSQRLTTRSVQTLADLQLFPIIQKDLVRARAADFMAENYRRDAIWEATSGTTGKYMRFAISNEMYQKHHAFMWHHRSWAGIQPGDRNAQFGPHRIFHSQRQQKPFWMYSHPDRRLIFSTFHITEKNLAAYTQKLADFQPRLIWGYPSAIYLLACFLENEKKFTIRPRAVVTSSETLLPFQRQKITAVFQAPLLNYYCNTERVANIMECEHGKLHLRPEFGIVEFLDAQQRPVAPGQVGRMVATGLLNQAMPLLRYDIGDLAIPAAGTCTCGRKSPLVEEIIGRVDDVLITADGRYVSRLGPLFHEIENIVEAQIIQHVKEKIIIRLVKKAAFDERDRRAILAKMTKIIGAATQVEFEFVDEIPRLPNGKYKFVISTVKGAHWFEVNP